MADPLNTARKTLASAQYVEIQDDQIERVAGILAQEKYPVQLAGWNFPPYPGPEVSFKTMFIYFLAEDAINYRYFNSVTGKVFADGEMMGAGLLAQRMTENLTSLTSPEFLASITAQHVKRIFHGPSELPDPELRARHLRAVGKFLLQRGDVDWSQWLGQFPKAIDLAVYLANSIEGFEDPFVKRAQLFVGMLVGRFYTDPALPANMRDLRGMTVYADYILPMVLRRMGILRYRSDLASLVNAGANIKAGSEMEREIRAATIIASQRLLRALRSRRFYRGSSANILGLDASLWLQGGEIHVPGTEMPNAVFVLDPLPHHRTETTFY